MECIRPTHPQIWVQDPPLPANAPVRSVLKPGEEVVILVEGFDPALAFPSPRTRRSVCAPPPPREPRDSADHDSCDLRLKAAATQGMSGTSDRPGSVPENILENDPDGQAIARNTAPTTHGKTMWDREKTRKPSNEPMGQLQSPDISYNRKGDLKEGNLFRATRRGRTLADEARHRDDFAVASSAVVEGRGRKRQTFGFPGLFSDRRTEDAAVQQLLDVYPDNDSDGENDSCYNHVIPLRAPTTDTANNSDGGHRRARSTFGRTNSHTSPSDDENALFQAGISSRDGIQDITHNGFRQDGVSNGLQAKLHVDDDHDGDNDDDEDTLTDEDENENNAGVLISRRNEARPAGWSAISISTSSSDSTQKVHGSGNAGDNDTVASMPQRNDARTVAWSALSITPSSSRTNRQAQDSSRARGDGTVVESTATGRILLRDENYVLGRNGGGTNEEAKAGFSEARSPPRSVLSSMFSAWGNDTS